MKVDLYNIDGQPTGQKVQLSDKVFKAPINEHAVYLTVKAQRANMRQGTHATKNRALVAGGGKKPWRQKGRGVARAGTIRSPLWVGGGRIFGPEPRDYSQKVNKKVKKLARRSVLSARVKDGQLFPVEDFTIESGKTREMAGILSNFEAQGTRTLLLVGDNNDMLLRACRNIPGLDVQLADKVSTYELVRSKKILLQKSAIKKLEEVLA